MNKYAHLQKEPSGIKIEYSKDGKNEPIVTGLSNGFKTSYLGKDTAAHGHFILIITKIIEDPKKITIERIFTGPAHQEMKEQEFKFTPGPHYDCYIFLLLEGQFFYYQESSEKNKIVNRQITTFFPKKSSYKT